MPTLRAVGPARVAIGSRSRLATPRVMNGAVLSTVLMNPMTCESWTMPSQGDHQAEAAGLWAASLLELERRPSPQTWQRQQRTPR